MHLSTKCDNYDFGNTPMFFIIHQMLGFSLSIRPWKRKGGWIGSYTYSNNTYFRKRGWTNHIIEHMWLLFQGLPRRILKNNTLEYLKFILDPRIVIPKVTIFKERLMYQRISYILAKYLKLVLDTWFAFLDISVLRLFGWIFKLDGFHYYPWRMASHSIYTICVQSMKTSVLFHA